MTIIRNHHCDAQYKNLNYFEFTHISHDQTRWQIWGYGIAYNSRLSYVFLSCFFLLIGTKYSLGGHSGQSSLHLSHQGNRVFILSMSTSRYWRFKWCHLLVSTIPGTTPHIFVNTEGNVNFLVTRSRV